MGIKVEKQGVSFGDDENALELDNDHECATLWIYEKPLSRTLEGGDLYGVWIISQSKSEEFKNTLEGLKDL